MYNIAYGDGVLVAVGYSGIIKRSIDNGLTWQTAASPTSDTILCVCYGGRKFVALTGPVPSRSYNPLTGFSGVWVGPSDLSVWHHIRQRRLCRRWGWRRFGCVSNRSISRRREYFGTYQDIDTGNRVRFGNGSFIVVGAAGQIRTSQDLGISWQVSSSGVTVDLDDITYGQGKWVAVGGNGVILTAADPASDQFVPTVSVLHAFNLQWQTAGGAVYQVQTSTDQQSWQNLGPMLLGDGSIKGLYDTKADPARFYRVQIK